MPYSLFAFTDLLAWTFFSSGLNGAATSLFGHHRAARQDRVPRSLPLLEAENVKLKRMYAEIALENCCDQGRPEPKSVTSSAKRGVLAVLMHEPLEHSTGVSVP